MRKGLQSSLMKNSLKMAKPVRCNSFCSFSNQLKPISEIRTLNYGSGIPEEIVFEKNERTMKKVEVILRNDTCSVLGYGPQGQAQALNLRDSGIKVCVGVRENGGSWKKAIEDGFIPGETLFPIEKAVDNGSIIMFLLSDAAEKIFDGTTSISD